MSEFNLEKLLLVGLGSIGQRHLENIEELCPSAKISILRSKKANQETGRYKVFNNIEDAINFKPQIAFICTPASTHMELALKLVKAGIHLFIEKPLSHSLEKSIAFIDFIKNSKVKVAVGYNLRFVDSLSKFKEIVLSNKYGKPLSFYCEVGQYLLDWRPKKDYRNTTSAKFCLGGGALLELSHEIDYLKWIFGNVTNASGELYKRSQLDIDVEDLVLANLSFNYGDEALPGQLHLDFLQRKPSRNCKVICEKGNLIWDAIGDKIEVHNSKGAYILYEGERDINLSYKNQLSNFLDFALNDKKSYLASPLEAFEVLKIVDLIKESSVLNRKTVQ